MELIEDMKPGHLATIYRDPLTEERTEGLARLISRVSAERGLQRWNVRFHPTFEEPIRKRNIAVLELDQTVGRGVARISPFTTNPNMHQLAKPPQKKRGRAPKDASPAPSRDEDLTTSSIEIKDALDSIATTKAKAAKRAGVSPEDLTTLSPAAQARIAEGEGYQLVPRKDVGRSPWNREEFSDPELDKLAESIRERGILQPLIVRANPGYRAEQDPATDAWRLWSGTEPGTGIPIGSPASREHIELLVYDYSQPKWEIIAGERRWLAAARANLTEIPVIVRVTNDCQAIEDQAVENLDREDLNPIHEAEKYQQLLEAYRRLESLSSEAAIARICDKLHVSKSTVYERLRLLKLPHAARSACLRGLLPASHAALIAKLDDADAQEEVTARILKPNEDELPDEDDDPAGISQTLCGKLTVMSFRDAKRLIDDKQDFLEGAKAFNTLKAEFEAKGLRVLTPEENAEELEEWGGLSSKKFVKVDDKDHATDWTPWKKALGAKFAPAEILAQHPREGKPVILYLRTEAEAALRKKGGGKKKTSSRPESEIRRDREHKIRTKAFLELIGPVAVSAEANDSPEIWKFVTPALIGHVGSDAVWRVVKQAFPEAKKDNAHTVLRKWTETATGKQLRGLACTLLFACHAPSSWSEKWHEGFGDACAAFGVKPPPWRVQDEDGKEVKI